MLICREISASLPLGQELGDSVPLVLDGGRCLVGIESTILDLTRATTLPPRVLRPGRVTPERIAAVIGILPETAAPQTNDEAPRVSGSMAAHYAPTTALRLVAPTQLGEVIDALQQAGRRLAIVCHSKLVEAIPPHAVHQLSADPDGGEIDGA